MNSVEIAMKMESEAVKFYTEAAGKVNSPAGKKMLLTIAEDEKRHLEMLNSLLKGMNFSIKDANPVKTVKTVFEQMKDEMIGRIQATNDDLEAFKVAMDMEKEGVQFYKKASTDAPTDKEKALFDKLVFEEEQHYKMFSNTYSFLSDTGNWFMWEERSIVEG
jgi:rubrerythrin